MGQPSAQNPFDLSGNELVLFSPDGSRFLTFLQLQEAWTAAENRAQRLAAKLRALGIDPES